MKKNIFIRVDGSSKLGWGHVFRCIGLAGTFRKHNIYSFFIVKDSDQEVVKFIKESRFPVITCASKYSYEQEVSVLFDEIQKLNCKLLIVDLSNPLVLSDIPSFQEYLTKIKEVGIPILLFDGLGNDCISARVKLPVDILVLPYVGAETRKLKIIPNTTVLCGPKYFILRKDIFKFSSKRKIAKIKAKTVLVSLGKGWGFKEESKIIKALIKTDFLVQIFIFTGLRDLSSIKRTVGLNKTTKIEFIYKSNLFLACLSKSDILITGSGLIKYEAAALGIPTISFVQNSGQEKMTQDFAKEKTLIYGGILEDLSQSDIIHQLESLTVNYKLRQQMSRNSQKIVDMKGGVRVLNVLTQKKLL